MCSIIKIQPQSGLGDLIHALPTIEAAVGHQQVVVATNHPYVLEPFGSAVETIPVEFDGAIPIINEEFTHLKYDRYGSDSYSKRYFNSVFSESHYKYAVKCVRARYADWCTDHSFIPGSNAKTDGYIIFAPPRAAGRHKNSSDPFQCAPNCVDAVLKARSFQKPVLMVGKDDLYAPMTKQLCSGFVDVRDLLSFKTLCLYVKYSDAVVSQIGSASALAGLFGVPTIFLPAVSESAELHERHVTGVIWPGQVSL